MYSALYVFCGVNVERLNWKFLANSAPSGHRHSRKMVNTLLPICLLIPYTVLIEGLPVQQASSPLQQQESEWDQCELPGYDQYEEQCGTKTVPLTLCNPGYKRVWWCVQGADGLPEGFDPSHDMCDNCQPNTFQKMYNKCSVCHPCSVCDEGETVEKACEMDSDTICTPLNPEPTTRSLLPSAPPLKEATTPSKEAVYSIEPSTAATPTDDSTPPTDQTDLPGESPEVLPISTPNALKKWLYVCLAFIIALAVLLMFALIGWCREYLARKKLQDNQENIPLKVMTRNGFARHEGEVDGGHEEIAPLLEDEQPNEEAEAVQNAVDRDGGQASGDLAVDGTTDNGFAEGSPDDAADVDAIGRSGSASDTATDGIDGGSSDGAHGSSSDGVHGSSSDGVHGSSSDGAHGSAADVTEAAEHPLDQHTKDEATSGKDAGIDGAVVGASSRGGLDFNIPDENPVGVSDGASGAPPDDLPSKKGTSDLKDTSASGDSHTDGADSGLDIEDIADKSTMNVNDVAKQVTGGYHATHDAAPDELATNVSSDRNSCTDGTCTKKSNNAPVSPFGGASDHPSGASGDPSSGTSGHSSGGAPGHPSDGAPGHPSDSASGHPSDGAPGHPSDSASGHPSDGAPGHPSDGASGHPSGRTSGHPSGGASGHPSGGADRRTNTTPEQVRPVINADDVVTTQFLQHVAQELPHVQIKIICRKLGLQERDISNVEALTLKEEQGFEFLKTLLGAVGKDLTYRSLLQAMKKSKNKHYADHLISDFHIELR